ncbi:N-acetylmuramoyl-L-alanine amidase [Arachidicoccus ginsenosidivorans]|uniref:N-acetylmuramoyl-L-alanine amidase n=1 Tax=Arachidicoccus ginsenosidivorans TaxID=496057 RepID=A0A5B8VMI0_9BACT|nr:N-acetylmuramoyl-L-alanine amidase [Arachidicoccus ginsenosidivorans]
MNERDFKGIIGVVIILLGSIGYIQAQQSTLRTIIVDPGHGLPDPGAKGHYSNESDIILAVAQKLVQKLRDSLPGVKVIMTRTDRNLPGHLTSAPEANRWRAKFANENHGDLFVCIHANDAPSTTHRKTIGYRTKVYYTGKGSKRRKHTRRVPRYSYYKVPSTAHGTETYVWAVNKNDSKQDFVQSNNPDELYGEKGDSTVPMFSSTEEKILATLRTKSIFPEAFYWPI